MNCYNAAGHLYYIRTRVAALQKVAFRRAKGHVLQCERWPFRRLKTAFWNAKGRLLQSSLQVLVFQGVTSDIGMGGCLRQIRSMAGVRHAV